MSAAIGGPVTAPGRDDPGRDDPGHGRRRWLILLTGMVAMTAGCTFQYGLGYLIPALRRDGLSLELAGLLVAAPTAGGVLLAASTVRGTAALGACLLLAGAAGASVYAASGRLILGWFAGHERGLAMGIRQSAQPLGVAVAALTLPSLAAHGRAVPLVFLGVFCLAAAALVAITVHDPPRPTARAGERRGSPYREPMLWRIHAASALLVVPQFTVATFALVYLVDARGWPAAQAGRVLAVAALCGAASRLAAGYWSDRAGSRMGPMRILAVATGLIVAAGAG